MYQPLVYLLVVLLAGLMFHPAGVKASDVTAAATEAPAASVTAAATEAAWQNTPNVDDVVAGDALALQPVDYAKVTVAWPGSHSFFFTCKPAGDARPAFKRAMILSYVEGNYQVKSTSVFSSVAQWEENQETADVEFFLSNDKHLTGEGFVYFYLVDENDVCVSNIVPWEVAFQ
ncbi:MAG: hypothetical protein GX418_15250 [Clostridiales bacterium]|nr:hypothetical protein [Clostridiales bacterium]